MLTLRDRSSVRAACTSGRVCELSKASKGELTASAVAVAFFWAATVAARTTYGREAHERPEHCAANVPCGVVSSGRVPSCLTALSV
jgi:hypothetical protein